MWEESGWATGDGERSYGWRFNGVWERDGQVSSPRWGLLPAGDYTLQVEVTGYEVVRKPITLVAGQKNDLSSIELKPMRRKWSQGEWTGRML